MKSLTIWESYWQKELNQLRKQRAYRTLAVSQKKDFNSNDYLSLARDPALRQSLAAALKQKLPISASASRLLRGHTLWHEQAEQAFAHYIQRPAAVFFSSGYMANIGVINTVADKQTALFSDAGNHASLIDGCRLSSAPCSVYEHKNTRHLSQLLKKSPAKHKIIVTESLFSMDGDKAPLPILSQLAQEHEALLIVDEAHATGIYGKKGAGFCSLLKEKKHIISIHPCGKALAGTGAFAAGTRLFKHYLINKCRTFIYSTAPSPVTLFLIQQVLKIIEKEPQRAGILKEKARFFRQLLKQLLKEEKNITLTGETDCPIVPLLVKGNPAVIKLSGDLQKAGYDIRAIRYPSVPKGKERVRICLHYNHTKQELQKLAHCIAKFIKK